jgi:hypothetical protein
MGPGIRRRIASWVAVAALICQVVLPFELAAEAGVDGSAVSLEANQHYHDPSLANSLGADWASRHSHTGGSCLCRIWLDLAYIPPLTVVDPPASPAVNLSWVVVDTEWTAPAPPAAESFSRPLPRAPPLSA